MSKTNIFNERIKQEKRIHEEMLNKELESLNKRLKEDKYNVDTLISKTSLGNIYHDLIDSKDKMNSNYQRKYNQTYHSIDVELYKLNKKIDRKSKMIDYKIESKKDEIFNKIKMEIL